ncbi:MAG: polysaccharide deacetylase family protein [Leptospirillum sp.]
MKTKEGVRVPPILYYHRVDPSVSPHAGVTPERFRRQMSILEKAGFQGTTLDFAMSHGHLHPVSGKKNVAITFDDGYLDNYRYAMPILQGFGFHATIFCISGKKGGVSDWTDDPVWRGHPLMGKEEMGEMISMGFEIGSHTRTHADLSRISSDEARDEIFGSKCDLEDLLGTPVRSFCYPFGAYRDETPSIVRSAGYAWGRSVRRRNILEQEVSSMLLPCRPISGRMSIPRFVSWTLFARIAQ